MTANKMWCYSLIVVGLPLVLGPQRAWAERPAHPPTSTQTAPRPLAKPLSQEEGGAVRAHVGKRCRLTFLDGSTREGVVAQVEPGAWIKLDVPAGAPETLSWKYIAAVSPIELAASDDRTPPPPAGPAPARADPGPPQPAQPTSPSGSSPQTSSTTPAGPPDPVTAAQPSAECTVRTPYCRILLQDGQAVYARVVDIRPGQSWTLRSATGTTRELAWSAVRSTEALPAPVSGTTAELRTTAPPPGPSPASPPATVAVDFLSNRPVNLWALPEGQEPRVLLAARTRQSIQVPRVREYRVTGYNIPSVDFELGPLPRYWVTVHTGSVDRKGAGIAMLSIGAGGVFASLCIGIIASVTVLLRARLNDCRYSFDPAFCSSSSKGPDNSDLTPSLGAGAVLLGVGGPLLGGGIALLIRGRTRVSINQEDRRPRLPADE